MFANKTLKSSDVSRAGMARGLTFVPAPDPFMRVR
jgi:hypothetical protein